MSSFAFAGTSTYGTHYGGQVKVVNLDTRILETTIGPPSGGEGHGVLRNIAAACVDEAGGLAYFSIRRPPYADCGVVSLNLNTYAWSPYVQTTPSYGTPGSEIFLDVSHNYGYVSDSGTALARFTLSPFAYVNTLSGFAGTLHTHAIDVANQRAYVCPYGSITWVYRVRLDTFAIIDYITLPAGEAYPWRSFIYGDYLYVLTAEGTGRIVRIYLPTFTRVDSIVVDTYGPFIEYWPYAIFGGTDFLRRVNLSTMSLVDTLAIPAGTHYAGSRNANTAIFHNNSPVTAPSLTIVDLPTFTVSGTVAFSAYDIGQYGDTCVAIGTTIPPGGPTGPTNEELMRHLRWFHGGVDKGFYLGGRGGGPV
jgi:hypothetical protein